MVCKEQHCRPRTLRPQFPFERSIKDPMIALENHPSLRAGTVHEACINCRHTYTPENLRRRRREDLTWLLEQYRLEKD